jgi:hypothetical protein
MNEMPKRFIIDTSEALPQTDLQEKIDQLYAHARDHEDPDRFGDLFEAIADFSMRLHASYSKEDLEQVRAYHTLIRSGVPAAHALTINEEKNAAIEGEIKAFVEGQEKMLGQESASAG